MPYCRCLINVVVLKFESGYCNPISICYNIDSNIEKLLHFYPYIARSIYFEQQVDGNLAFPVHLHCGIDMAYIAI